jgi:signal transduction histidine kinase/CheY-like chemotaxis protein
MATPRSDISRVTTVDGAMPAWHDGATPGQAPGDGPGFLSGGGDMGALIKSKDWSHTPLGPVESWSQSLRMMVSFLLANRFPLLLWWGPRYVSIYNDAYRPILGAKHPRSLGQPASECWSEIWQILEPLIDTPFKGGPATWMDDLPLEINRYGFVEETHFTVAYSPVPDETAPRGIGGVLATVHEITEKVVGERRVVVLRDLGAGATQAKTAEEACAVASGTLAHHGKDIPFALLYLIDAEGKCARLAGAAEVEPDEAVSPATISLEADAKGAWPLSEAIRCDGIVVVDGLAARFNQVPSGPWSDPPQTAVVVPVRSHRAHQLAALLVAGVSPRLPLDEIYRSFFDLVAAQIATSIANARAYEEERRRAEALAEIDRAKTAFFSNVSHEFRTPLTLLRGPIEQILIEPKSALSPEQRALLEVAHRNSLRLLRLVNTLLDFSRVEAGRIQACFEPVDFSALTTELASNFRSACERAGLRLDVDCPPLGQPVYLDREMWEKIVLNLISNAFKFTLEGSISVEVRARGSHATLLVTDTGLGIPEPELPHIFERFHRVEGQRGRTHEGTGIGLSLVQELVRLHHGAIEVESKVGQGTTFTVSLPFGYDHLPPDHIQASSPLPSTALGANAFVEEALRWLPSAPASEVSGMAFDEGPLRESELRHASPRACVLVVDDNADMRDYMRRLLAANYDVEAVSDGEAALACIGRQLPELVLADIMMPRLDGLELLARLRSDSRTRTLPIILVSARAGVEMRAEGLAAGADDYLIKPFTARELLAKVAGTITVARLRRQTERVLRRNEAWLAGQTRAFQAAVNGAPLEQALGILVRTAIEQADSDARCAFNIANQELTQLRHVVGMSEPYARDIDGFKIGLDSLACGLAVATGAPVITHDVLQEPRWASWVWLAEKYGYRACWSFPVETSAGHRVGSFAMYFRDPRSPTPEDRELVSALTHTASIIISRHQEAEERTQAVLALRQSEARLQAAVELVNLGQYAWDPRTNDLKWDDTVRAMWGLPPGARVDYVTWRSGVHPDDLERVEAAIARSVDPSGDRLYDVEYRVSGQDGVERWIATRGRMNFDRALPSHALGPRSTSRCASTSSERWSSGWKLEHAIWKRRIANCELKSNDGRRLRPIYGSCRGLTRSARSHPALPMTSTTCSPSCRPTQLCWRAMFPLTVIGRALS